MIRKNGGDCLLSLVGGLAGAANPGRGKNENCLGGRKTSLTTNENLLCARNGGGGSVDLGNPILC